MTVAILGGAGYIGSHCARYLHQQGYAVAIYDRVMHPVLREVPIVQGDISDIPRLKAFLVAHRVRSVIHCAGKIDVAESVRHPERYHRENVGYTQAVLELLHRLGIDEFIFSSSCAVYGNPRFSPLTEQHPIAPLSPYGETKAAVEDLLKGAASKQALRSVALRFFNAAGADPRGDLGENHEPETHLIPNVLAHLADGQPLHIFGDDYATPDGTCVRDYVHVWDLAQAHALALRYLRAGGNSEVFNLGNGRGHSVKEVIASAEAVVGQKAHYRVHDRRPGDPAILVSASLKAHTLLGWRPERQAIHTILNDAWRFYRHGRRLYRLHDSA